MSRRRAWSWEESAGRPMLWFWVGLCAFGEIGVAIFVLNRALVSELRWILALILLATTGGLGVWAIRRAHNRAFGSGLFVGYAVATVFSGGQWTLWASADDYGILGGGGIYVAIVSGTFVIAILITIFERAESTT